MTTEDRLLDIAAAVTVASRVTLAEMRSPTRKDKIRAARAAVAKIAAQKNIRPVEVSDFLRSTVGTLALLSQLDTPAVREILGRAVANA